MTVTRTKILEVRIINVALLAWALVGSAGRARAQPSAAFPDGGVEASVDAGSGTPGAALELLYHGDLDGRFAQPDCQGKGVADHSSYARLLGLFGQLRAGVAATERPASVALLGGNLAAPDLLGRTLLEQGVAGVAKVGKLLARAGYDAVALGHHDLALEPSRLLALVDTIRAQGMQVVVTNLVCEPARAALCERTQRHLLVRRGDTSVGVVATIAPSVLSGLAADSRAGLRLDEPLGAIQAATQKLRAQGTSYVVAMVQGPRDVRGLEELDALQRGLAKAAPGDGGTGSSSLAPDVILSGGLADDDGNRALELLRREDAPPAVGGPRGPVALARVRLAKDGRGRVELKAELVPVGGENDGATSASASTPDVAAEALLAPDVAAYCRENQQPLAPAPVRGSLSRDQFVTYALEIMRRRAGAELALVNSALVKAAPFPLTGTLTRGRLYAALPYQTVIGVARVTGATLASVLGPTLDNPKAATVGLGRQDGRLLVNGRPLDKARSYRVATISFVAAGGDDIIDAKAIPWRPLPGEPELREAIAAFLRDDTGRADGDPGVDPRTDFGPLPAERLLLVGLTDGGLDVVDTRIQNGPEYGDPQLTRGRQRMWKVEWTGIVQTRHPRHESDSRLNLKYGWTRSQPAGGVASSTETTDLITLASVYNYRGLRADPSIVKRHIPDPYARIGLESEFTRPALSATQTRTYHHLELTNTVGAMFSVTSSLKLRGGAGVRKELLTDVAPTGRWRPVLEAGGMLSPTAIATVGPLPVRAEGFVDYTYVDPTDVREHQLRGSGKLSVPLLPLLFITVGLDVFAVQRQQQGWAASYDTTIGLRVHLDSARQWL